MRVAPHLGSAFRLLSPLRVHEMPVREVAPAARSAPGDPEPDCSCRLARSESPCDLSRAEIGDFAPEGSLPFTYGSLWSSASSPVVSPALRFAFLPSAGPTGVIGERASGPSVTPELRRARRRVLGQVVGHARLFLRLLLAVQVPLAPERLLHFAHEVLLRSDDAARKAASEPEGRPYGARVCVCVCVCVRGAR